MGWRRKQVGISLIVGLLVVAAPWVISPAARAQDDQGAETYRVYCASCHGSDGAGAEGEFPPLAGNPNVEDATYVEEVIRNGQTGEIVVLGATYDGHMPSFESLLAPEEIASVSDYVRSLEPAPTEEGGTFPWGTVLLGAGLIALAVGSVFLFASPAKKEEITWGRAYIWAGLVFIYFVLATAWFPSWIVSRPAVAGASRWVSDVVGSAAWLIPLALGIAALRWLQRKERI